jgi:Rrf2 family protein
MTISKTIGYALVATVYIAKHYQKGLVEASVISKRYNISLIYLFRILQMLKKAKILHSQKGVKGGFTMARPAKDITLLEIIEAVDGPMVNYMQLAEHANNEPFSLKMEAVCQSALGKARDVYGKVKLSDMLK